MLNQSWTKKAPVSYPVPVIICGGRAHTLSEAEKEILRHLLSWLHDRHQPAGIVVWDGDAPGVDRQASAFARELGYPTQSFQPAQGELSFLAPTTARNEEMAARAANRGGGYTIALEGGTGTADMIRRALRHHLRLIDLRPIVPRTDRS